MTLFSLLRRASRASTACTGVLLGACGGAVSTQHGAPTSDSNDPTPVPAAASVEISAPSANDLACDASNPGAASWQDALGQDDVRASTSVATDAAGNVFFARAAGQTFKVANDGTVLWTKPFGSSIATDTDGDLFVAGTFTGSLSIDQTTLEAASGSQAYIAKLAPDGTVLFASALGSAASDGVRGLAVGADASVVVSGSGFGTTKLDANGKLQWQHAFSGAVAVDSMNDVVITGGFSGSETFGSEVLQSAGGEDVFVVELDGSGNVLFARRFGDAGATQHGEAIAVDPSDDFLVSGVFDGSVDFGTGPLTIPEGACNSDEACNLAGFVVKLDPSGAGIWSQSRVPVRTLPGIASDSRGDVIVSGASPGDAPPYQTVLLMEFDENGEEMTLPHRVDLSVTDAGAGHGLAVDRCGDLIWSVSVPAGPGATGDASSVLAKFSL